MCRTRYCSSSVRDIRTSSDERMSGRLIDDIYTRTLIASLRALQRTDSNEPGVYKNGHINDSPWDWIPCKLGWFGRRVQ